MTLKLGSIIRVNEFLSVNDYIESPNRLFFAILQEDGNFVVYKGTRDNQQEAWWATNKYGNPGKFFAILQTDGNFVVYKGTSPQDQQETWWATNKYGNPGKFFAILKDDGNFVVYKGTSPQDQQECWWATNNDRRFYQWQKDNWETIKNKRLWQIAMPATHDSGCYGKCWQGVVDHAILDYNPRSKSQGASIYEQLFYGIRQFDLRFKNYGDKYYVFHGTDVFDITFDTVLNDIKKFLDETEKEILILCFRFEEKSGQAEVLEKIGTDIVLSKEDVTHLGRNWPANCTPEKLIEIGKRVILMWDGEYVENAFDKNEHSYDQYIWRGNGYMQSTQPGNYGSAFTTDELIEGRTRDLEWWRHNYRNIYFPNSGKCWFGLGVHLTTLINPFDIFPHDDHEHWHGTQYNLETLAGKSLPKVLEKLRGDWKNEPWNIVGADLFDKKQYLDFSEAVIDLNNNNFPYSIPNEQ